MNVVPKYHRLYSGSLYARGYSDGYNRREHTPHWIIDEGGEDETIYVSSEEEVQEYSEGYNDGKFKFTVDAKQVLY